MSKANLTGWTRYHICGRGGGGFDRDRWVFCPGTDELSVDEIQDYIIHTQEQWAAHADRVSFECFVGEVPSKEIIYSNIRVKQRDAEFLNSNLHTLREQLSEASR
jgi:hypothetical protein